MCIRTSNGKWVSGRQAKTKGPEGNVGVIMTGSSADEAGLRTHR